MIQIVAGGNNMLLDKGVIDIRNQNGSFRCLFFNNNLCQVLL